MYFHEVFRNWPECHKSNQEGTVVELIYLDNKKQKLNVT